MRRHIMLATCRIVAGNGSSYRAHVLNYFAKTRPNSSSIYFTPHDRPNSASIQVTPYNRPSCYNGCVSLPSVSWCSPNALLQVAKALSSEKQIRFAPFGDGRLTEVRPEKIIEYIGSHFGCNGSTSECNGGTFEGSCSLVPADRARTIDAPTNRNEPSKLLTIFGGGGRRKILRAAALVRFLPRSFTRSSQRKERAIEQGAIEARHQR